MTIKIKCLNENVETTHLKVCLLDPVNKFQFIIFKPEYANSYSMVLFRPSHAFIDCNC